MSRPLRTILIGCGNVAVGYSLDRQYKRWYRYATHADVLATHPDFAWVAAIDPLPEAQERVRNLWPVPYVAGSVTEAATHAGPLDVAVIATPPSARLSVLNELPPSVRAIIVEKPLGETAAAAEQFLAQCRARDIYVQVNLWRRADELHRRLAMGDLREGIGALQAGHIAYGGGLKTTGTHLVDWVEMQAGPIISVRALKNWHLLQLESGAVITMTALDWNHYRELTIEVWGRAGRLTIANEALGYAIRSLSPHRAMRGYQEVAADQRGRTFRPTVGTAYYNLYSNLAAALAGREPLWADGQLALRAATVIEAIEKSSQVNGALIAI